MAIWYLPANLTPAISMTPAAAALLVSSHHKADKSCKTRQYEITTTSYCNNVCSKSRCRLAALLPLRLHLRLHHSKRSSSRNTIQAVCCGSGTVIFKSQSTWGWEEQTACDTDRFWRGPDSYKYQREPTSSVLNRALWALQGQQIYSLRIRVTSSLNVTYFWPQHFIPGHARLGTALYTSTLKSTERDIYSHSGMQKEDPTPFISIKFMLNPQMMDITKPDVCISFKTQVKKDNPCKTYCGCQSDLKIFCMFLYKKVTARAFSSPICISTGTAHSIPLRARGLQTLLCPAQGFSTLSTDLSSKDNQVRWSNGPAGPYKENELWVTWILKTLIQFLPPATEKWNSEPSFTLKSAAQGCSHMYLRQKSEADDQGRVVKLHSVCKAAKRQR